MDAERNLIRQTLEETGWNISAAARSLGVERTSLHKRIKSLVLVK
jgi:two-component system, NtrC family, nitrogen regulation response regulator NtrX